MPSDLRSDWRAHRNSTGTGTSRPEAPRFTTVSSESDQVERGIWV
jgi:hypothetical protein